MVCLPLPVLKTIALLLCLTACVCITTALLPSAQALPAAEGLRVVCAGAGRTLATLVAALLLPAACGVLRAVLSGNALLSQCMAKVHAFHSAWQ